MRAINDTNAPKRLVLNWRLQRLANTAKQKIGPLLEFSRVLPIHKWGHHMGVSNCDTQPHNSLQRPGIDSLADSTPHVKTTIFVSLHNTSSFNYLEH